MKSEQEIKSRLEEVKLMEKGKGNLKSRHITPRNWGWIRSLEWVLED